MKHPIPLESWNRKEHFRFFHSMNDPFTGITANMDCTQAYKRAKEMGTSFYFYYLYYSLVAVNRIETFRYRIENDSVYCYDKVHAAATTDNNEGTFSYIFLYFQDTYSRFEQEAKIKTEQVRAKGGLCFDDEQRRPDCIHYTTLPWVSFTGLKHATDCRSAGSCPRISFGKYFKNQDRLLLPVSVEVNHALMDGRQIGEYYQLYQELLDSPD